MTYFYFACSYSKVIWKVTSDDPVFIEGSHSTLIFISWVSLVFITVSLAATPVYVTFIALLSCVNPVSLMFFNLAETEPLLVIVTGIVT